MAVWQASFHIVPHERVAQLFPGWFDPPFGLDYVEVLPTADAGDLDWWTTRQPTPGFRDALDALLPRSRSWSPELERWGAEDGDRFDVYSEGSRVSVLFVRFDLRAPNDRIVAGVASLAADLGCDFVGSDNMLYEGSADGLAAGLRNSSALQFVRDPISFLQRVRSGAFEL